MMDGAKCPYRDASGAELRVGDTVLAKEYEGMVLGQITYCTDVGGWTIRVTHKLSRYTGRWADVQGGPVTQYSLLTGYGRKRHCWTKKLIGVELMRRPYPADRRRNVAEILQIGGIGNGR